MWRFAAGQATGTAHVKAGVPCQDRVKCVCLPNGLLVAALADGAGSAKYAETGAEVAVNTAVNHIAEYDWSSGCDFSPDLLVSAAQAACASIRHQAIQSNERLRDFAATFLFIVATRSSAAALQIGDGLIVTQDDGNGWKWIFWPERGEYANTTRFLTDEDAFAEVQVHSFDCVPMDIALMSDGLESLALHYASKTAHEPFFGPMLKPLWAEEGCGEVQTLSETLRGFLTSPRIRQRTDDDLSLLIATRRPCIYNVS